MWYNVDVTVEATFTISADAANEEEANDIAMTEAFKRIKRPSNIAVVDVNAVKAKDQSNGRPL